MKDLAPTINRLRAIKNVTKDLRTDIQQIQFMCRKYNKEIKKVEQNKDNVEKLKSEIYQAEVALILKLSSFKDTEVVNKEYAERLNNNK